MRNLGFKITWSVLILEYTKETISIIIHIGKIKTGSSIVVTKNNADFVIGDVNDGIFRIIGPFPFTKNGIINLWLFFDLNGDFIGFHFTSRIVACGIDRDRTDT